MAVERFGGFDAWVNNAGIGLIATVAKWMAAILIATGLFGFILIQA